MQFRDLSIGDTFDWIDPERSSWNSFYRRCVKVSARCYEVVGDETFHMRVGTIQANVYHVEHLDLSQIPFQEITIEAAP